MEETKNIEQTNEPETKPIEDNNIVEEKPGGEPDLNSLTDSQLEEAIMEMQEKIRQRKQQQDAIKLMIQEQEDEFIKVQSRNDIYEKDFEGAKREYEKINRSLQLHLKSKEDLFVKLQKIQADID